MANDFSADSTCISIFKFESDGITIDAKGSQTLTVSSPLAPDRATSQFQEGSSSCVFVASGSEYLYRTDANLSASFPLKSGTANKTMSIAGWIRFVSLPAASGFMDLWGKTIFSGSARTLYAYVFNSAGSVSPGIELGKTDGTYSENIGHASTVTTNTWYHLTTGYRDSDKAVRIFLRDTSGNTIGSDISTTAANNIGLFATTDFMLGTVGTGASPVGSYFDGYQDEVVVFSKLLTATDATNIAKGLYSGTGDSGATTSPPMFRGS